MRTSACVAALLAAAAAASAANTSGRATIAPRPPTAAEILAAPRDGTRLLLLAAVFDPAAEEVDFTRVGLPGGVDPAYAIVQFEPGRLDAKEELARAGVGFVGYLPDNAFQLRLNDETRALVEAHPAVRFFGPYKNGYKVHPRLWPGSGDAVVEVTVRGFPDAAMDALDRMLAARANGRRLLASDVRSHTLRYAVSAADRDAFVAAAAEVSGVALVEPYDPVELHNNDALGPIQSNAASSIAGNTCSTCTIFNHGLTGAGQIAAIADSGNDSDMCFQRYDATAASITDAQTPAPPSVGTIDPTHKMIAYYVQPGATAYDNNAVCTTSATSFHGTHTSSTLVGDNFASLSTPTFPGINPGDGMAPNAKLVFQDVGHDTTGCLSGLNDPYAMYLQALNAGARVHSNSYGSSSGGAYTSDDATTDRFLFDHEDMTIFFSAGNSGSGANTIGSPGNSKNAVTVGALGHGNSTTVAGFSSRGPTDDGRVKPDIMAPGVGTISASGDTSHTSNNCGTKSLQGTSMSTPTVAGGAVLLRQYFEDGYYPSGAPNPADSFSPRAAAVKATLLNGTLGLPAAGPFGGFNYGWGRVFLDNNLGFAGDARDLRVWNVPNTDGLQTGGSQSYQVTVAAGQEFRATLVWMDAEGSPGAALSLVNNLNLTVTDGATTWLGNVFTPAGQSTPGGAADAVNTVEQVRLSTPTPGTYTITVSAPTVPGNGRAYTNRQGFALVASCATCASGVAAAPTGLAAVNHAPMGVDLSWASAPSSAVTQVYRAAGDCSAPPRDFQFIGATAGTSLTDSRAQGGLPYAYTLRGADGCGEGPASACVSITPNGVCDLVPAFGGLTSVAGGFPDGERCRVRLGWNPATSSCPAGPGVRYDIYRSTTPNFSPSPSNLLTTVAGTTLYDDNDPSVVTNTTYYYVVRAEDTTGTGGGPTGGNQEPNSIQLFATAVGPPGAPGTFADGAGDGQAYGSPESPWRITNAQAHTGTFSYHPGPDNSYPTGVCGALTTPALSLNAGAVLSYWARYNAEDQFDGAVVEISTNGGASWQDLPPTTPAGYPGSLAQTGNACGYPAGRPAFSGPAGNPGLTAWTQYQTDLSAFAGQSVKIRWRFTSDGGVEFQGFFLDDVQVTNVNLPGACVPTPVQLQHLTVE